MVSPLQSRIASVAEDFYTDTALKIHMREALINALLKSEWICTMLSAQPTFESYPLLTRGRANTLQCHLSSLIL